MSYGAASYGEIPYGAQPEEASSGGTSILGQRSRGLMRQDDTIFLDAQEISRHGPPSPFDGLIIARRKAIQDESYAFVSPSSTSRGKVFNPEVPIPIARSRAIDLHDDVSFGEQKISRQAKPQLMRPPDPHNQIYRRYVRFVHDFWEDSSYTIRRHRIPRFQLEFPGGCPPPPLFVDELSTLPVVIDDGATYPSIIDEADSRPSTIDECR